MLPRSPGDVRSEVGAALSGASPAEALTAQPAARRGGVFTAKGWAKRWGCRLMEVSRIYSPSLFRVLRTLFSLGSKRSLAEAREVENDGNSACWPARSETQR